MYYLYRFNSKITLLNKFAKSPNEFVCYTCNYVGMYFGVPILIAPTHCFLKVKFKYIPVLACRNCCLPKPDFGLRTTNPNTIYSNFK